MFTHFLVPVDGSELSEGALQAAIALAQRLDARLTVFYALPTAGAYAYATVPPFVERSEIDAKTLQEIHQLISDSAGIYLKGLVARFQQVGDPPWLDPGGGGMLRERRAAPRDPRCGPAAGL